MVVGVDGAGSLLHGAVDSYADLVQGNEPATAVQRINYDTALNGRLSVYGLGGNDILIANGNGADVLDGGEGSDTYNVDNSDTVHDTGTTGTPLE